MQEISEHIVLLLYKRIAGEELEEEETEALSAWLAESPHHQALLEELLDESRLEEEVKALMAIDEDAALKKIQSAIGREKGRRGLLRTGMVRYVAAAVMLLLSVVAVYTFLQRRSAGDIEPGGNNALLILADGSAIRLDNVADGILKQEKGAIIHKEENSRLVYEASPVMLSSGDSTSSYNTITTPRKGQYQLVLPDGSKVWLNASSSLHYPTVFTGPERVVTLKGEAFFDIAPQHTNTGGKIPLTVIVTDDQGERGAVKVLGTRFNINAYPGEATMDVTLVDGVVQLQPSNKGQSLTVLKPGQEAQLAKNGSVTLTGADTGLVTAWKEGNFLFRDTKITSVMRALSRWYGVNVVYEGTITQTFTGQYPRSLPMLKLLGYLEHTGDVSFSVKGNTVTVKGTGGR